MTSVRSNFSHLVASRQGLYVVSEAAYECCLDGLFFGLTIGFGAAWLFESLDGNLRANNNQGRILRLPLQDGQPIGSPEVVADGLDNGCHQIDFIKGCLVVTDTYRQKLIVFSPDFHTRTVHQPVGQFETVAEGSGYVHMNSLGGDGRDLLLLLSYAFLGSTRNSEVVRVNSAFEPVERFMLPGRMCHDLVVLEDGQILSCGSLGGTLISQKGVIAKIDNVMTRGLSVGHEVIAVGSSVFATRMLRREVPGHITFLDRQFQRRARLALPAAPTQIRRLDGLDLSLFDYRALVAPAKYIRESSSHGLAPVGEAGLPCKSNGHGIHTS